MTCQKSTCTYALLRSNCNSSMMGGVPPPPNNMGGPPPNAGWRGPGQYQNNYTPGRDDGGIPGTNRYRA
ncbi:unnamed protein product [Prunus armeniaca]|uniref:Uncharacterized protein n=1 Tax=Prunus armeniaca TaxID=36596 RepID=A0A6J5WV96_PRUAR|nr:unnamed protein product [Prunus armeniaca]CAB4303975.1 unnamed protein product [Prunus armeniaca]